MSSYLDVHQKVRTFLKGGDNIYSDEAILNGINAGLGAILPWLPKRSVAQGLAITSGSLVELPDDVYLVDAVYYPNGQRWLEHWSITPSKAIENHVMWIEYPSGYLSFSSELEDATVDVFYYTNWAEITTSGSATDSLEIPAFANLAVIYYATSYVLTSSAISSAMLRQFNTKIDSGQPDDSPIKDMASLLMQRFLNEVKLFPALERAHR